MGGGWQLWKDEPNVWILAPPRTRRDGTVVHGGGTREYYRHREQGVARHRQLVDEAAAHDAACAGGAAEDLGAGWTLRQDVPGWILSPPRMARNGTMVPDGGRPTYHHSRAWALTRHQQMLAKLATRPTSECAP